MENVLSSPNKSEIIEEVSSKKKQMKAKIVRYMLISLGVSYFLSFVIVFVQLFKINKIDLSLVLLIIASQTSLVDPLLGFYFADKSEDDFPKYILENYDRDQLVEFDNRLNRK